MGEYLTVEQIEKFQKDGILVVENFLSQDEVKNMREEILKLVQCGQTMLLFFGALINH